MARPVESICVFASATAYRISRRLETAMSHQLKIGKFDCIAMRMKTFCKHCRYLSLHKQYVACWLLQEGPGERPGSLQASGVPG
jgi:hypothetical protein